MHVERIHLVRPCPAVSGDDVVPPGGWMMTSSPGVRSALRISVVSLPSAERTAPYWLNAKNQEVVTVRD